MIMDNLNRLMRQFKPMLKMLLNERGEIDVADPAAPPANEFFNSIPEPVRQASLNKDGKSTLEKFNSLEGLAKSYVELEGKIGAKGIIVPGKDAKPEEREAFLTALGRPPKPEEYKFSEIKELHKSINLSPESVKAFQSQAHKLGLSQEQADGLNQWHGNILSQIAAQQEKAQNEAMLSAETSLRKDWGEKYDDNKALVGKAAATILSAEELASLGGAEGLGNNPIASKLVYGLASRMSEDSIRNLRPADGGANQGQPEALKQYKSMMAGEGDLGKALFDDRNPRHDEAVKEKVRLANLAYPDQQ